MATSGVYGIVHIPTARWYIGVSKAIEKRWVEHKADSVRNHPSKQYIHKALAVHGVDNFEHFILEECAASDFDSKERHWITRANSFVKGFNLTSGGVASTEVHVTVREVIANKLKGVPKSEIAKQRMSASQTGKKQSPETIEKRISALRGKKRDPLVCAKISQANKGKKRTAEQNKQNSERNIGKKHTEEFKQARRAQRHTKEARAKIAEAGRRPCSEETKQKLREAHLRRAHNGN